MDVQQKLLNAIPQQQQQGLIKNCQILLQASSLLQIPVIISEQYPKGLGHTVLSLTTELEQNQASTLISKTCFSCCREKTFMQQLEHSREQIIITGMESHICVLQTAIQCQNLGYQVFVIEDAIVARSKLHHKNAIARMRDAGIIISNIESLLFEWLTDSTHPDFKTISKLIR